MAHSIERNFQRSRSLPIWAARVLDENGRCVHTEEHVNLDDAQRAAVAWCEKRNLTLTDPSEWLIG